MSDIYEVNNDIALVRNNAKTDACAKHILSNKYILAWIARECTNEFKAYSIEEITKCIESIEYNVSFSIGGTHIHGLNTEDNVPNEGKRIYDLLTFLTSKENVKIFLNIEPNGNEYGETSVIQARKMFYAIRGVSRQLGKEFTGQNYQDIKKFYSIWIILNSSEERRNTVVRNFITQDKVDPKDPIGYDLFEVITIYLGEEESDVPIINLLNTVFNERLDIQSKLELLKERYDLPVNTVSKKEIKTMGGMLYGYIQRSEERGRREGIEIGKIESCTENIKSLIDTGEFSFEDAIRLLKINGEIAKYIKEKIEAENSNK